MDAKDSNGKGRIDDSGLSAATVYRSRRKDVAALLDLISLEVDQHAAYSEKEGLNWAHCGDLGHVREKLSETLAFLAQRDEQDIKDALADAAAGREES